MPTAERDHSSNVFCLSEELALRIWGLFHALTVRCLSHASPRPNTPIVDSRNRVIAAVCSGR